MTKKEMINKIVEGHVDNVTEWALRDLRTLRAWLLDILGLEKMTKEQLEEEFYSYLEEP